MFLYFSSLAAVLSEFRLHPFLWRQLSIDMFLYFSSLAADLRSKLLSISHSSKRRGTMSSKGKRKEEHDNASDGDSEGHAPPKKTSKTATTTNADSEDPDSIVVCEISKNRRVSVRNWQGRIVVDIREFYVKDGKQLPGKKGYASFTWNVLRNHVEEIDKAVTENS
ncbi:RNA polymerase II transcriptional coactivator KIWI isoform X2 [Arachis hypogaea]|uniref:RNA polymerase II transcriptional coactivator KIWI isoform X2 n=1 Tax=Arachis hypogaea TaxID=3818 RepID=UPI003B21C805